MSSNELGHIAIGQPAGRLQSYPVASADRSDCVDSRQDLLRRFTSTPYARDLQLMQRTIRVETNNQAVLDLTHKSFETHQHGKIAKPQFLWRIVCESDPETQSRVLPLSGFSDEEIRYGSFGQGGFLAVDLESRRAVAFLSDQFLEDGARFRGRPPINALFCMTASSLGLTMLSGGCVSLNGRGLLVFGPPNSGKSTACYLAAKLGTEFQSDQLVFLDMKHKTLRAWGDPFPAVFRPETVAFLPELREFTHRSTYGNLSFFYFDKRPMQPRQACPLEPIGSVFLHRTAEGATQLKKLSIDEARLRLQSYTLFNESPEFDEQVSEAISAIAAKQSYSLRYGSDPKRAAGVIRELLR